MDVTLAAKQRPAPPKSARTIKISHIMPQSRTIFTSREDFCSAYGFWPSGGPLLPVPIVTGRGCISGCGSAAPGWPDFVASLASLAVPRLWPYSLELWTIREFSST